uniref:(northern house mosquito) hypothetical protein n=1 Tax=Culex pipiens TaxID=7175 RepID=A0A8D8F7U7_CULPI
MVQTAATTTATTAAATTTTPTADAPTTPAGHVRQQHAAGTTLPATTPTPAADGRRRLRPGRRHVPRPAATTATAAAVHAAGPQARPRPARPGRRQRTIPATAAGSGRPSDGSSDAAARDAAAAHANGPFTSTHPISAATTFTTSRPISARRRSTVGFAARSTLAPPHAFALAGTEWRRHAQPHAPPPESGRGRRRPGSSPWGR